MDTFEKKPLIISSLLIFFPTILVAVGASFLFKKSYGSILQIGIMTALFALFLTFSFLYEMLTGSFDYDNLEHPYRFLLVYAISLVLSALYPYFDVSGWMFVALGVAMSLFSNRFTGLFATAGLIMMSCLLSGQDLLMPFIVYFLSSAVAIMLFRSIDENFKVTFSIFLSMLTLLVFETAGFVFLKNEELNIEQFLMPVVNISINTIILFGILKYFNDNVANRYRNMYLELNDQEYEALIQLKEKSKEEYFRSIHTAYLTERIAGACECNVDVAKNLAYYHRIKKCFGYSQNDLKKFVKDNSFPPEAAKVLVEFSDRNTSLVRKESCIVYLSDKLIYSIMQVFAADKNAKVNYNELIDTMLNKKYIKEALADSDMTGRDMKNVREIMKKEILYYDFLR